MPALNFNSNSNLFSFSSSFSFSFSLFLLLLLLLSFSSASPTLFIKSARVNLAANSVTLPLYSGSSRGRPVYFILLDSSDSEVSSALGLNVASKLNNARSSGAVQRGQILPSAWDQGGENVIDFPASVDFRPSHRVVANPTTGFPPLLGTQPGSVGEEFNNFSYSPLVWLPNGTIFNAPHVANDLGQHDKVLAIDVERKTVTLKLSDGFSGGKRVKYLSTDASDPIAAALEESTLAPSLNLAPRAGDDSTASSRASLAAFVNGQIGGSNPQRQGLNSALLDGLSPLNVLAWSPNQGRYSPLWDVHLAKWSDAISARGANVRQTSFGDVLNLAAKQQVTHPNGGAFGPAGFVVNCPIVMELD